MKKPKKNTDAMSSKIDFENILLSAKELKITEIHVDNNITYFKVNGELFGTYGSRIHHNKSIMFDHPVTLIAARNENDPLRIIEQENDNKDFNDEWDLINKHRFELYKTVMVKAFNALQRKNDAEFTKIIDKYFFITLEDEGKELLKKIDKKNGKA